MDNRKLLLAAAGVGAGWVSREIVRRRSEVSLRGDVVAIAGGSRGLGLALAEQFARQGCRLALCARDGAELQRAESHLRKRGAPVFICECDVTSRSQVENFIHAVRTHYGRLDILVNNAGEIQVGPVEFMKLEDYEAAMATMFWGVVYPTLTVLPAMLEQGKGRIVNITSIGGKVSVPHLLPYNCAKFAAVGFSEGLRAEMAGKGIAVTTVAPGMMRTGSHVKAKFKGDQDSEAVWFSLSASLPGISMSASRAARQIVSATRRGESEKILSTPANLMARFHGLFPGVTLNLLGIVNDVILPAVAGGSRKSKRGRDLSRFRSPVLAALTILGRMAARRYHQYEPARA